MRYSHFLLIFLLGLLSFSSCKKDEDDSSETSITGTYTLTSISSNKGLDPEDDGTFGDTELLDNLGCSSILVINDEGTFTWNFSAIIQTSGGEYGCFGGGNFTGTYQIDGNSITLSYNGQIDVLTLDNDSIIYQFFDQFTTSPSTTELVTISYIHTK